MGSSHFHLLERQFAMYLPLSLSNGQNDAGKEYAMEGLLGMEAKDKERHYQLRTFRLMDVYKVVSPVLHPIASQNSIHMQFSDSSKSSLTWWLAKAKVVIPGG